MATVSLRDVRYAGAAIAQRIAAIARQGASAIVLVSGDLSELDRAFAFNAAGRRRGTYGLDTLGAPAVTPAIPVVWVSSSMAAVVRGADARLVASLGMESFQYPSVNVVARVNGTDPARRDEYVLFSAHQDHDGVRFPLAGDSIWNGADDNASVAVGVLAMGRAVARSPMPRRRT